MSIVITFVGKMGTREALGGGGVGASSVLSLFLGYGYKVTVTELYTEDAWVAQFVRQLPLA